MTLFIGLSMSDGFHTPLDPQEIAGLIPVLSTQEELNEAEHLNIEAAIEWYVNRKRIISVETILSEKWVRLLHKKMYQDVWEWAGEFRRTEKNIGLPDWTRIRVELKQALDNAREQCANVDAWNLTHQEIAVQLSHKAVWVHPFPNGNGRWSRELANAYLIANKQPVFTWGAISFSDSEKARKAYIKALRSVDETGSIKELLKFAQN